MIGSFTFENLPCRVVFGSGTLAAAKAEVERLGGKRALDRMLAGNVSDLVAVRQYLDAMRGGWA